MKIIATAIAFLATMTAVVSADKETAASLRGNQRALQMDASQANGICDTFIQKVQFTFQTKNVEYSGTQENMSLSLWQGTGESKVKLNTAYYKDGVADGGAFTIEMDWCLDSVFIPNDVRLKLRLKDPATDAMLIESVTIRFSGPDIPNGTGNGSISIPTSWTDDNGLICVSGRDDKENNWNAYKRIGNTCDTNAYIFLNPSGISENKYVVMKAA